MVAEKDTDKLRQMEQHCLFTNEPILQGYRLYRAQSVA